MSAVDLVTSSVEILTSKEASADAFAEIVATIEVSADSLATSSSETLVVKDASAAALTDSSVEISAST